MPAALAPPKLNISPLIRFARWSALLTGIIYGAARYNYLAKREVGIQIYENEIKERHRIKSAEIKKQSEIDELNALGKEAGIPPK